MHTLSLDALCSDIRPLLRIIVPAFAVLLSGCGWWDWHDWRQKVIVEVQTPNGIVTGTSVQDIEFSRANFSVPGGDRKAFEVTGEGVIVDLASAGKLFVLLSGKNFHGSAERLAPIAFASDVEQGYTSKPAIDQVVATPLYSQAPLPEYAYPLLVTFDDLDDPATVREVDPADLAATFGPGYALRSISVQMTDEPNGAGEMQRVLPWLGKYFDKRLDGDTIGTIFAPDRLANDLASGSFSTER